MRSTSAVPIPIRITRLRWAGGRPAASAPTTIALFAGQHEIDQDDLANGGKPAESQNVGEVHRLCRDNAMEQSEFAVDKAIADHRAGAIADRQQTGDP